jgi:YidC/Oxa1 family membrane protein insertase
MDKRTLLAVAICMGILLLWWKLFPPAPPPAAPPAPPAQSAPGATPQGPSPGTAGKAAPAAAPTAATREEQKAQLESDKAIFELSSWGGLLRQVTLKDKKFTTDAHDGRGPQLYQLVQTESPAARPLRTTFPRAEGFTEPDPNSYTVSRPAPDAVTFRAENEGVAIEKRYKLGSGPYVLQLDIEVENKTDKQVTESLALYLYGKQDPQKKGEHFWEMASANTAAMVCYIDGSRNPERSPIEPLLKESKKKENEGVVRWIAADDKYFAVAAVLDPEKSPSQKCQLKAQDAYHGEVFASLESRTIEPHAKTVHTFLAYAGPKYIDELEAVNLGKTDPNLDKVVDVNFAFLAGPLLHLLKWFYTWLHNWGLAIIMLTLFVKVLTFYPTQRAMMSGKRMQRLAPKVQALRKKFENDRQKLGVETMNLYKAHGVSPFGGCLPSLITMPIWIALYSTLNYAVELHRAPFLGFIKDLSAPFWPAPIVMGIVMYLQMRMSPAGADPQQQKMMSIMMPVMFTGFSLFLPAGLSIYMLTNSLLTIAQQLLINRMDKAETDRR